MLTKISSSERIMDDFIVRPPTMEDVAPTVELFNTCSMDMEGTQQFTVEEYLGEWQTPGFDLDKDCRLVLTPAGDLVGCAEVWSFSPHVRNFIWVRVHPDYRGRGVGTYLTEWATERTRQVLLKAPPEARVVVGCGTISTHQLAADLLQAQGFKLVRHFLSMKIEMNGVPPLPVWPEGITIRPIRPEDEYEAVYRATDEAFKDHWGHVDTPFEEGFKEWMHWINTDPKHDPSLWFLAMDGDQIAGISLCSPHRTEYPDMGWVNNLAVLRPWRRRGLALALLQHSFAEFYQRGKRKVGLGVDASSLTGATRLYEKAGMHPFRQWDSYEKELRPGIDLSTQAVES